MKRNIIKIGIISIIFIMIYYSGSYANQNGTTRMQVIDGKTDWTNITVSQSYDECESLNSGSSTLGTTSLKAHLTTDADWSAMAIFSVSQYGGQTSNAPTWTNGNKTGIKNVGSKKIQTTGVLDTANSSTSNISGLFNNDNTPKKYVKQWSRDREVNNFVGFSSNGTYGWLGGWQYFSNNTSYPASIKNGMFGVSLGYNNGSSLASGGAFSDVTYRPVIWN